MKVTGFSHVTINVRDLPASLRFYVDLLGMRLVHRGEHDVYLEWGAAWLCLQERERGHGAPPPQEPEWGVDHVAFHMLMSSDSVTHKCPVKMSPGPTRP